MSKNEQETTTEDVQNATQEEQQETEAAEEAAEAAAAPSEGEGAREMEGAEEAAEAEEAEAVEEAEAPEAEEADEAEAVEEAEVPEADEAEAEDPEEAEEAPAAPRPPMQIATSPLSLAISSLVDEKKALRDRWLRTAADFENFKKRSRRDIVERAKQAEDRMVLDFLPVVDNLERALEHSNGGDQESALVNGVDMVYKQFLSTLERYGITPCEAIGQPFDPEYHEAIQQMHSDQPAGSVCNVLQRGFRRRERLVRAALVVVSLGPMPEAKEPEEPAEAEEPEVAEEAAVEAAVEQAEEQQGDEQATEEPAVEESDAEEEDDGEGDVEEETEEETPEASLEAAAGDEDAENEQQ